MHSIRQAPTKQTQIIRRWFNLQLTKEIYENLTKNSKLVIVKGKERSIFLVSDDFLHKIDIIEGDRKPASLGVYFGDVASGRFQISLPIISLIAKHKHTSLFQVILNGSGEQHFLYGRNPQKRHILKTPQDAAKGTVVIPVNIHRDPLGLGRLKVPSIEIPQLSAETPIIKNIIDLGWYLRKGE